MKASCSLCFCLFLFEVILFKAAVTSVHTIPEATRTASSREYKEKNSVSPIWGMSILFKAVMLSAKGKAE